jgi:hypothetical protein
LYNHGFKWGTLARSLTRPFVARPFRLLAQSATVTIPAAVPQTRHWCALTAMIDQFGRKLRISNVADLKLLPGLQIRKSLLLQSMSAVEHKLDNTKQLFVPGSASNYPFKPGSAFEGPKVSLSRVVCCCRALSCSAFKVSRPLVESRPHDNKRRA